MTEIPEDVMKAAEAWWKEWDEGTAFAYAGDTASDIILDEAKDARSADIVIGNGIRSIARAILAEREAQRERDAKIADEHRARVPGHDPEKQSGDLVAYGYGNAAFNIAAAIRTPA